MKKASVLAYVYAAKCQKNEIEDSIPFLQIWHYHYRITKNGEILRKCETEIDVGERKKRQSGQWVQIGRVPEVVKDTEKLSEIVNRWKHKLEQLDFDVEVEIYED